MRGVKAELIAAAAGELAEGLPEAIRRAVRHNKVPRELHEDLWRLADRLQPLAVAMKRNAAKLPQLATRTALATEKAADAATEVRGRLLSVPYSSLHINIVHHGFGKRLCCNASDIVQRPW